MRNCNNPTLRLSISNDNGNNCCRCGSRPNPPVMAGIMLVPGDLNGAVGEMTRQAAGNILAAMNFDSNTMRLVDNMLSGNSSGQLSDKILVWINGLGNHEFGVKVVPGGTFQPNVLFVPNIVINGLNRIMLVPSDSGGVISNNTMLNVGNMLAGMGATSAHIQNVNNLLASVGPLSPVNASVCIGQGRCSVWFAKVPGNFQPQMLLEGGPKNGTLL